MSNPLVPCAVCARHVRASSSECPFCGSARSPVEQVEHEGPMPRLSRAMAFAFGATLLAGGAALDGCVYHSEPVYGAPVPPDSAMMTDAPTDASTDASTDAPSDTGGGGVRYGAPPPDGG